MSLWCLKNVWRMFSFRVFPWKKVPEVFEKSFKVFFREVSVCMTATLAEGILVILNQLIHSSALLVYNLLWIIISSPPVWVLPTFLNLRKDAKLSTVAQISSVFPLIGTFFVQGKCYQQNMRPTFPTCYILHTTQYMLHATSFTSLARCCMRQ